MADVCRAFLERGEHEQVALRSLTRVGSLDDLATMDAAALADVDLAWRVLARRAELGDTVGDDEVAALEARDPDPDSWVRALTVRTSAPTAEAKATAWTALVDDRSVPIGSVGAVARALWRPGHDDLLAPYADRFLDALPRLHHGGMIPAMVYAGALFPVFGIDAAFLDRAEATSQAVAPVVHGRMVERADEIRRMLVTRAL